MLLCYNFVFNSVFYRDDAVMVCLGLGIKNALLGFRRAHGSGPEYLLLSPGRRVRNVMWHIDSGPVLTWQRLSYKY